MGAYHYSYAATIDEARREAEHFLQLVSPYQLEYPAVYDFEDGSQAGLPAAHMRAICAAWLGTVQGAGYYAALYSMASWLKQYLNGPELEPYDRWVAHVGVSQPMVSGGMWQYSWTGSIPGIKGDVDLDFAYRDYPELIRSAGLNGWRAQPPETPGNRPDYRGLYEACKREYDALRAEIRALAGKYTGV